MYLAATICVVAFSAEPVSCLEARSSDGQHQEAASDVDIEQAHGRVPAKGKSDPVAVKPTPEAAAGGAGTSQNGPATCNSQNSSSEACYTATQQARPATR